MKNKINWLLAVAVLSCLVGWTGYAQKQTTPKQAWEYNILVNPNDENLSMLGTQGWELVSVTTACNSNGNCSTAAYLKRAK